MNAIHDDVRILSTHTSFYNVDKIQLYVYGRFTPWLGDVGKEKE